MTLPNSFIDFLDVFEKRTGMFLAPVTFDGICAYLEGYQACCWVERLEDPLEGMRELIQCRLGRQSPLQWAFVIQQFFVEDEDAAIPIVFSSIRDLHRIKREKGLEWLKAEFEGMQTFKRARPLNLSWPFNE